MTFVAVAIRKTSREFPAREGTPNRKDHQMTDRHARLLAATMIASSGVIAFTLQASPSDAQGIGLGAIIIGAIGLVIEWRRSIANEPSQGD